MFSARCLHIVRSAGIFQTYVPEQLSRLNCAAKQRLISTSNALHVNYYESLGVSPKSTQNEIKAAYYKLSMIYHPDKNQGSESAAKKFREITQAYEVLSNYRLRRLYDKGIIHTAGPEYAKPADSDKGSEPVDVEDDPQTKFYKSRFTRSTVTKESGQTPIYDFDEWAKAHYGKSFDRRKTAKERHERREEKNKVFDSSLRSDRIIFGALILFVGLYFITYAEQSYDTPKTRIKKRE